jgi:hypothetical protein
MSGKRREVELWCDFSDADIQAKARDLSAIIGQLDQVQIEKKNVTSTFNDQIEGLQGNVHELAKQIREKGCNRPVECETRFHEPAVGLKRTTRLDTGATVLVEEMTPEERQENLFGRKDELDELDRMMKTPDPPASPQA